MKEDFQDTIYYEVGNFIQSYKDFRRLFLQVVRMWVHPDFHFLFAPARVGKARLEQYGIISHLPCIKAERVVNSRMAIEIHKAMASITTRHSMADASNLAKGTLKTQPCRMKWRGRVPWHDWVANNDLNKVLPAQAQRHQKEAEEDEEIQTAELAEYEKQEDPTIAPESVSFTLKCPKCQHCKDVGQYNLRLKGTWCSLQCKKCGTKTTASKWRCACGLLWTRCAKHFSLGLKCRRRKSFVVKAQLKRKQKKNHRRLQQSVGRLGDKAVVLTTLRVGKSGCSLQLSVRKRCKRGHKRSSKNLAEKSLRPLLALKWQSSQPASTAASSRRQPPARMRPTGNLQEEERHTSQDAERNALRDLEDLQQEGVKVVWPRTPRTSEHECLLRETPVERRVNTESNRCRASQDVLTDLHELQQAGFSVVWPRGR